MIEIREEQPGDFAAVRVINNLAFGSMLIEEVINILKKRNCPFIIVLGHPEYYLRFGFQKASLYDIRCQWVVPEEAFMILVIDESAMSGQSGTGKYRDEFNEII